MRFKQLAVLSVLSFSLLTVGCGGGEEADDGGEGTETTGGEMAPSAPLGTASVTGTVSFTGTAPQMPALNLERECAALHDGPVMAQKVVVNDGGTLKWVLVYVKDGLPQQDFAPSSEPVVLDQEGCQYTPHVFGVQAGQPIQILNSDPLLHNIHALPETNRPFNFGMPNQGDERTREFREAEVPVRIKCDVHPWMEAWAGVFDHPYFATTGDDGTFQIEGLPAGTYTIEAWHEEYGTQTTTVTVGDGEAATADFSYGGAS